ncbi:YopX family protein, partial [Propionigenium maris]|uniref:YopX family protein n=1 Tax=Propionigenium maris TaxID=45622 RepID=UPI002490BDE2
MREVKFRIWDKLEKKYSKEPYWNINQDGFISYGNAEWKDEAVLEQYTGIKDKNGKEIYEGDVISDGVQEATVIYWRNGFCISYKNLKQIPWINTIESKHGHTRYEIIG